MFCIGERGAGHAQKWDPVVFKHKRLWGEHMHACVLCICT